MSAPLQDDRVTVDPSRPATGEGEVESRRQAVRKMFNRVSGRYDLLNRVLSLGMDGAWRRYAVRQMALSPGDRALDVACGTGDLGLEAVRNFPGCRVVGIDFASAMLDIGRAKLERLGREASHRFANAAAENLPFRDDIFAASAIAFGIRNVPDRRAALLEMKRTVRPGGRVVVLELTMSTTPGMTTFLVNLYARAVLPLIGGALSKGDAYQYLSTSMDSFPEPADFVGEMESAGLAGVVARRMFLSPAWVFTGTVPPPAPSR